MNETTKFIQALSNVPSAESDDFWRFFAEKAKQLPEEAKLRPALCIAISDLKAGRNEPRANASNKWKGMRALSKDKLYESILHQRERLVPFIDQYKDWKNLISHWILMKKLDNVREVLDALDCPHDEKGACLEDQPPIWSPEEATQRLMTLGSHISFADLEIIAAGLFCNHERWRYLEEALDELHEAAKQAKEAAVIPVPEEPTFMTTIDNADDLARRVQALSGQIDAVTAYLQGIIAELQAGRLPDLITMASTVAPLHTEWTALITELQPAESSLVSLIAALDAQTDRTKALILLDRLRCLRYQNNPDFPGTDEIRKRCAEIRERFNNAADPETIAEALQPFHALERLANEHQELDEAEFAALRTTVAAIFGELVANAAGRGRLEWDEPEFSPPYVSEPNLEPDYPEPLTEHWSESDLKPEPLTEHWSESDPEPVSVPVDDALQSFQAFQQAFWLNPTGEVQEAPWRNRTLFASELNEAVHQALNRHEFGVVLLLLHALDELGQTHPWTLGDWQCAAAISEAPAVISIGVSHVRTQRLQAVLSGAPPADDFSLALFLEAIRPEPAATFSRRDIDRLLETRPFQDHDLMQLVDYLFQSARVGVDPLALLKVQMTNGPSISREQLLTSINDGCRHLHKQIVEFWSAAGGRIKQTHSRNAWKKFIEKVIQPLRDQIPVTDDPNRLIARLPDLRTSLQHWTEAYNQVMDDAGVLLHDRRTADRWSNELAGLFQDLLERAERLQNLTQSSRPAVIPLPASALQNILDTSTILTPFEELCRQIFLCLLGKATGYRPLCLAPHWLRDHPALLGELDPEALREAAFVSDGVPIQAFRSPHLAAAAVLCPHPLDIIASDIPGDHLLAEIRERALEYPKRPDLLSSLSAVPHLLLESSDRNRLHRSASDLSDDVFKASETLTACFHDCQSLDLATPSLAVLQTAMDEARRRANVDITQASLVDGLLLQGWIEALTQAATAMRERALASYRQALDHQSHLRAGFDAAIANHDLRRIPALLSGHEPLGEDLPQPVRRTPWRTPDRVEATGNGWIEDVRQRQQESGGEIRELIDLWINPPGNIKTRQKFRRLFYRLISGEEGIRPSRRKRVFPDGLVRISFEGTAVHIPCRAVREMFRQRNPTFLPQLADYTEIVLMSPPATNLRGGGAAMAADWGRSASAADGGASGNALVVFLAPGLSEHHRKEILSELRTRRYSAVLVDNYDFWRLIMIDDHNFVPFLEIVMEQLRLERISPFSNQDGQHIRLETYVGREDEAKSLAQTAQYSRVFSGRKLGKSALLKQVEIVYDQAELPSSNRLNVLFVTIAGGDSEDWIVDQIAVAMSRRFELVEPSDFRNLKASERFSQLITNFAEQYQHDSLLIILDEADQFVEEQLACYDRDREKSLSFRMMKLTAQLDSHGIPRVRIILSGYRVTHTREGVWANAGGVLRLSPLQESEAIKFIQGALARIGIDIAEHASFIARRCGFQPAILISFGQTLLNRLQPRRSPNQLGEYIAVSAADVAETFNDGKVIEEIRTVVNNNFQGNRVGGAIFGALLLVMRELPPGFPLRDAPRQILEKLREIEPDLAWLRGIDPTPEDEIKRNLRDFIDRGLLIEESGQADGETYRLRFSHYLPVLTQQNDQRLTIQQLINALLIQTKTKTSRRRSGSILTESSLDKVRYWYDQDKVDYCQMVLVGGGWLKALDHPKVGIADRLGDKGLRVFTGLNVSSCTELAKQVHQPAIVLGGIDLLRWALHAESDGTFLIETVPIQRITDDRIAWWFESARALHFESADALARIAKATGGIPFLLEKFDAFLPQVDGSEVSTAELHQALTEFQSGFAAFAEELSSGPATIRLTPRERELIILLALIAKQRLPTHLGAEFCENWELCKEDHPWRPPYADSQEDDLALQTLISAGLLSVDDCQMVQLLPDGAEAQLAAAWGPHGLD